MAVSSLFVGLVLGACDDNLTKVGTTIQPPEDLITVYTDTFQMKASTVRLDSVFAKTSDCLLGEMYDPVYGNIKADVLCQFYCEEGFEFSKEPYNGKIDSVELLIFHPYRSSGGLNIYGDSLSPMQLTVYPIDRPLARNFYTNDNPENYSDMQNPFGAATFTAHDFSISDSVRNAVNENGYKTFTPYIRIKLPTELGQKFYEETINNPSSFASQDAFNEFFPGIYITNTYGSGCLVKTQGEHIEMHIYYNHAEKDTLGQDSLIFRYELFGVSKDIIQINRFENHNLDQLLDENDTHTYVRAPAGVCTRLVLPTTEISANVDINDRYINGFTLELKYLPEDEWDYAYAPPSHLLLLPEDSLITFFEKGSVENYTTSFISYGHSESSGVTSPYSTSAGYNSSTRTYSFGNVSPLLKAHIDNSPDKDLNLLVIPVNRTPLYSNSAYYTTDIKHSFDLAGARIRTEEEFMKVVVLSSKFENK